MSHVRSLTASVCLCLAAMPGLAAVSAEELWATWQQSAADAGLSLTAATKVRGDGELRLNGLTLAGAEAGPARVTLPALTLTETAEGGVEVTPLGDLTATGGEAQSFVVSQTALVMRVTEEDAGLVHHIVADRLALAGTYMGTILLLPDGPDPQDTVLNISLTGLDLRISDTAGASRVFGIDLLAKMLAYDVSGADPTSGYDSTSSYEVDDLTVSGDLALAENRSLLDIDGSDVLFAQLRDGLSLQLESSYGNQRGKEVTADPLLPLDVVYSALPGETKLAVNAQTFLIHTSGEGLAAVVNSDSFANGQSEVTMGPLVAEIAIPGPGVQGAGDWAFKMDFADVVLGEPIWAVFDPEAVLQRGAITAALDLGWRMEWDFLRAMEPDADDDPLPEPKPESLTLRSFQVSGAGLMAKAAAAFSFTEGPPGLFGTITPEGTGTLKVTGLNGLINDLIALGTMTSEDAMGMRMAMAAFLKPEGEDRFTSAVEARPDWQIFVNGARLK